VGERQRQIPGSEITVGDALRTSLAENTRIAYRRGWGRFADYCEDNGRDPMAATPDDVANFLVRLASAPRSPRATSGTGEPLAPGTIRIAVSAINRRYRERNLPSPAADLKVAAVLRGLGRLSNRRRRQVKALREQQIGSMLACCDELGADDQRRVMGMRDAALIAVGFAGALRRSEICALQLEDFQFLGPPAEARGMLLHIRRSKTDQEAKGQTVAVPEGARIRPVGRLREWLGLSGIACGPVFQTLRRGGHLQGRPMHPTDVARLIKRYVRAAGMDPAEYSGHSLRAGFVTCAAVHGARLDKIMEVTRHSSAAMVLRYVRQADAFEDHAGSSFL